MNFWDQKYSTIELGYGEKPNEFFKQFIQNQQPGKLLLPGEGEGRNAVYAAKSGWDVTAFDSSVIAREKALLMAEKMQVKIDYYNYDVENFKTEQHFNIIAIIFMHLIPELRKKFHQHLMNMLTNDGQLIMEVFSKEQLSYNSGGPKNIDLLYSVDDLKNDFGSYNIEYIEQVEVMLNEGPWHQGKANVIRLIVKKF